jgi:hypothetical protein
LTKLMHVPDDLAPWPLVPIAIGNFLGPGWSSPPAVSTPKDGHWRISRLRCPHRTHRQQSRQTTRTTRHSPYHVPGSGGK